MAKTKKLHYNEAMPETILTVKNLTVTLDEQTILQDLSFELNRGENLAVIGPNGSGKTVLLRTLLGALPHIGEVRWAPSVRLGYVPQKVDADRHLPLNARNLLESKARVLSASQKDVESVIREVGLTRDTLKTPIGHLSGGQFQKSLIAFALLGNPEVVLFDEPTASLDQPKEEQIYELIHRLQDERGITVILVSHDLSLVYRYATKVLCLNKRNLCFGTPEEALTPEILEKLYGSPFKYYHHLHHE